MKQPMSRDMHTAILYISQQVTGLNSMIQGPNPDLENLRSGLADIHSQIDKLLERVTTQERDMRFEAILQRAKERFRTPAEVPGSGFYATIRHSSGGDHDREYTGQMG